MHVCSTLRREDGSYAPAYMLADGRLERAGRTSTSSTGLTSKVDLLAASAMLGTLPRPAVHVLPGLWEPGSPLESSQAQPGFGVPPVFFLLAHLVLQLAQLSWRMDSSSVAGSVHRNAWAPVKLPVQAVHL